jgi:iron complex transport system substrate-binding protein
MKTKTLLTALAVAASFALPLQAETIKHVQGELEINAVPQKVIGYSLAALDTLDVLGVTVDGLAGGTLPPYLARYETNGAERVGTLFEPDFEAIAAIQPDLIIAGDRSAAKYADLAKIAPTIDLTIDRANYLDSVRTTTQTLGQIFDKQAEATAAIADLDASLKALREKSAEAGNALVIITTGGRMSAHGPGSRFDVLYSDYGFKPAVEKLETGNHGQAISNEFLLETNPDWLFVVDRDAAIGREGSSAAQMLDNELVRQTSAWKNNQIVYLDSTSWYLVGGGLTAIKSNIQQLSDALSKN